MSSGDGERGYKGFAETLEDAQKKSAEVFERAEAAEAARLALEADDPCRKNWRALRVLVASALAAKGPPGQRKYSQPYVDGQREAYQAVAEAMKRMEEGS